MFIFSPQFLFVLLLFTSILCIAIEVSDYENYHNFSEDRKLELLSSHTNVEFSSKFHTTHHSRQVMKSRFELLRSFAKDEGPKSLNCSKNRFIIATEIPWGRSGNLIIELTHGLWIAKVLSYLLLRTLSVCFIMIIDNNFNYML